MEFHLKKGKYNKVEMIDIKYIITKPIIDYASIQYLYRN